MGWFDEIARGLGTANAPFGFAPVSPSQGAVDPAYNAGMEMIGNIGMGMLASGTRNPVQALGRSYLAAQNQAQEKNKQDAIAAEMLQSAADKRAAREEEKAQKDQFEAWVKTLPPNQQALARLFPEKFGSQVVAQQFPDAQGGGGNSFGTPLPYQLPDGSIGYGLPNKNGGFDALTAPNGAKFLSPGEKAQQQAEGRASGAITGEAKANLPGAIQQAGVTTMQIDNVLNDPNLDSVIGWNSWRPDMLASNDMINLRSKIEQLKGDSFLQARQILKGGGQITDYEGKRADQAYNRMEIAIKSGNVNDFKSALADFRTQVQNGIQKLQATAGGGDASAAPASPAAGGNQRYKFNPATGELE